MNLQFGWKYFIFPTKANMLSAERRGGNVATEQNRQKGEDEPFFGLFDAPFAENEEGKGK